MLASAYSPTSTRSTLGAEDQESEDTVGIRMTLVLALLATGILHATAAGTRAAPEAIARAAPSDFNGDGFADLAIGVQDEAHLGGVNVLYGSATGTTATNDQLWTPSTPGIVGAAAVEGFGESLASADFNGDGYADLAIGSPSATVTPVGAAGAVNIVYGSAAGLAVIGNQRWSQETLGGGAQRFGDFGRSLAAGDFDADGFADLAIGAPEHSLGQPDFVPRGLVVIVRGSAAGLTAAGAAVVSQATAGVPGAPGWDRFGSSLATGDLDGDGFPDLAIGVPEETVSGVTGAGSVNVVYGSAAGLTGTGAQRWNQDSPGIKGVAEAPLPSNQQDVQKEHFGHSLAIGDFDNDRFEDLAVGVPWEVQSHNGAGAVNVLSGSPGGLTANGDQFWHQGVPGVPGTLEHGDVFGADVAAGDLDGDGRDDLAIGVPGERFGGMTGGAGVVDVLYGGTSGLSSSRAQVWSQDSPGIAGTAEPIDGFGHTLAIADFGRSSRADLAIDVVNESIGAHIAAGMVHVLYGTLSGLNATGSQAWTQDSPGVEGEVRDLAFYGRTLTP